MNQATNQPTRKLTKAEIALYASLCPLVCLAVSDDETDF